MTIVIGLTGSIGMGKSTTAQMFADEGIPVWDADQTVHDLYGIGGAAVEPIRQICPAAIVDGAVDRNILKKQISDDSDFLNELNAIVHPLVARSRESFIARSVEDIVLLDVPLLFETGVDKLCDLTVVVHVPEDVQKQRVLSRGTMTEDEFDIILARQMPDAEKRARADHVIPTLNLDETREAVRDLIAKLRQGQAHA